MRDYILTDKPMLMATALLTILEAAIGISLAFILSGIVNSAIAKDTNQLKIYFLLSLAYIFVQYFLGRLNNYLKGNYVKNIEERYRGQLFGSIFSQNIRQYHTRQQGEYLSLLTDDTDAVMESYVSSIFSIASTVTTAALAILSLIYIEYRIILLSLVVGIVYMWITGKLGGQLNVYKDQCYEAIHGHVVKIKELLGGYEVVKSNNLGHFVRDSFDESKEDVLEKKRIFAYQISNLNLANLLLGQGLIICILSAASLLVIGGGLLVGDLVAIAQLLSSLIVPIASLNDILNERRASKNLLKNQLDLLRTSPKEVTIEEKIRAFQKEITLRDLSFGYGEDNVLKQVNLTFEKGKKYAIVGESGSGKSTLCKLLLNYYDDYEGSIAIDGQEYRSLGENALSDLVSTTQQEIFLFDGSIKENITLFRDVDPLRLTEVIQQSGLERVLSKENLTLETEIQENGNSLSGGERQRIAIARMLLRGTGILILDEATSALDAGTAGCIMNEILQIPGLTCIVVTHKLKQENAELYDEVIQMRGGRTELLKDTLENPIYALPKKSRAGLAATLA